MYPGEAMGECLERELSEELAIEPKRYSEIKTLQHTYQDGGMFLITFFLITDFEGEIENKVFENIAWVRIEDLHGYDILEGSVPIIHYL